MQIEQVKEVKSVESMRAEIFRLRHYDMMIREIMDLADYTGLSAEDRYTMLAYNVLRDRQRLMRLHLNQMAITRTTEFYKPPPTI